MAQEELEIRRITREELDKLLVPGSMSRAVILNEFDALREEIKEAYVDAWLDSGAQEEFAEIMWKRRTDV